MKSPKYPKTKKVPHERAILIGRSRVENGRENVSPDIFFYFIFIFLSTIISVYFLTSPLIFVLFSRARSEKDALRRRRGLFFFASYFLTTFRFIFYLDENILGCYRIPKYRGLSFFPGECHASCPRRALRRWHAASATLGEKSNKTVFYPKEMVEVWREGAF